MATSLRSLLSNNTGGSDTRTMALTVLAKKLNPKNPEDDYFEVADDKGNKFALVQRGDRTPLADAKVHVSGVVVAEAVYQEDTPHASGLPILNSRYVTCPVANAKEGTVMTAIARVARSGTKADPSACVEVLMPAIEVTSMDEARAAFVDAIEKNRDSIGWPAAIINVSLGDDGFSRVFGGATVGEAGSKRIAPADAQAAAFDGKPAAYLKQVYELIESGELSGATLRVVPVMRLGMGKDSSKTALTDAALGAGGGGVSNFTRFHPRENVERLKDDGTTSTFERLMFTPMIIGIQYGKTPEGTRDPSRPIVVKVVPAFNEATRPTASVDKLQNLSSLFEAIAGPVPISAEPAAANADKNGADVPQASVEDESEDFNLDDLEANLFQGTGAPGA